MAKLFSIKTEYSQKILRNEKLVEFRRQDVNVKENETCFIYSSGIDRKILGYFLVKEKLRGNIHKLWEKTKDSGGITKKEFFDYFKGCRIGTAIILKKVKKFAQEISLYDLKKKIPNFKPPQSYYNLNSELKDVIRKELGNYNKELSIK